MPMHSKQILTALEKTVLISPLDAPNNTKAIAVAKTAARRALRALSDILGSA
jgi:hypothetical protein